MGHCKKDRERKKAACILCTLFLVFVIILLLILYFTLFKPKDPNVQVPRMQLLSVTTTPNYSTLTGLSLSLLVSMYNPNRGDFYVEEGSIACLYFRGTQVATAPIPTGLIFSQSSTTLSVTVNLPSPLQLTPSSPPPPLPYYNYYAPPPPPPPPYSYDPYSSSSSSSYSPNLVPLSTAVVIQGHVTTANMFSHHSNVVAKCSLTLYLAPSGGSIQSSTCTKSYSLDD